MGISPRDLLLYSIRKLSLYLSKHKFSGLEVTEYWSWRTYLLPRVFYSIEKIYIFSNFICKFYNSYLFFSFYTNLSRKMEIEAWLLSMYQTLYWSYCISYSSLTIKIFTPGNKMRKLRKCDLRYFVTVQCGISSMTGPWPPLFQIPMVEIAEGSDFKTTFIILP